METEVRLLRNSLRARAGGQRLFPFPRDWVDRARASMLCTAVPSLSVQTRTVPEPPLLRP
eukprot:1388530-Amphidinium_carterae.2